MLLNTSQYLCTSYKSKIQACSPIYPLKSTPKNLYRTSQKSFLYCDISSPKTLINQFHITPSNPNPSMLTPMVPLPILTIQQIQGIYTSYAFNDQSVLLLNRNGDFYYHNLINRNVFIAQKQHPGLYTDADIHTMDGFFVTVGGCVRNYSTSMEERIIKDTLDLKARISTGHNKSIQNSFLFNQKVITMSCDKTLRLSNLCTQQVQRLIQVPCDMFSGCALDHNNIVAGGLSKSLLSYDLRTPRLILSPLQLQKQLIVTKIIRFNDNSLILSNYNQLHVVDLRMMKVRQAGKCEEGERISQVLVMNRELFVVGNRERTLQVWRAC